jgi:hypothetical protein
MNQQAYDLLMGAPSEASPKQLRESGALRALSLLALAACTSTITALPGTRRIRGGPGVARL